MTSKPGVRSRTTCRVSGEGDSQHDDEASSCEMTSKPATTCRVSGEGDIQHEEEIDSWSDELTYGNIYFTAAYSNSTKTLLVHMMKAEGLPSKKENSAYDVHLLIRILPKDPGDSMSMISHVSQRSFDPVFDEHFSFYVKDINVRTMKISVFDHNCQFNINAVGHSLVFLGDMQHKHDNDYTCKLYRQPKSDICQGHIHLRTHLIKQSNMLEVFVDCAKGLQTLLTQITPRTKDEQTPDILNFKLTYVIVEHHCGEDVIKTLQSQDTLDVCNPEYNTSFEFNLAETANPSEDFIVVTVMKKRPMKESEVGHVVIGPFYYATSNVSKVLTPWGMTMAGEDEVSGWYRIYA